jgi:1-acyl-sn-glycerol-3-phosphate acyltransferase
MSLRACRRAVALAFVLVWCIFRFWLMRLSGPRTLERRAVWLQKTCVEILRSLEIRHCVEGQTPREGLVVSNHLSYLDIVILSAAMPCFFVSKAEIDNWPFFGKAARTGGTLFIDRSSLASAEKVAAMIGERLKLSVPVLLFPEGTSTDGTSVLRFHSRLFEPAIAAGAPITAASVRYVVEDGTPERELCWYGDETFVTHLVKTLNSATISAVVRFGEPHRYEHRRLAADQTHDEVAAMRGSGAAVERGSTLAVQ